MAIAIELSDHQAEALREVAARLQVPEAELAAAAVRDLLAQQAAAFMPPRHGAVHPSDAERRAAIQQAAASRQPLRPPGTMRRAARSRSTERRWSRGRNPLMASARSSALPDRQTVPCCLKPVPTAGGNRYAPGQGLIRVRPTPAKTSVLRVARLAPMQQLRLPVSRRPIEGEHPLREQGRHQLLPATLQGLTDHGQRLEGLEKPQEQTLHELSQT